MPASSFSKIAIQFSRFANFQAAHQGANAFRGSAAGTTANAGSGGAAASLSSAGAGPGSGAGGAKFSAGRGAYQSYTNTGGRAVVQAGSSSTNDGSNPLEDDEEHHALAARGLRMTPRRNSISRAPVFSSTHALRFKSAFAVQEVPQQQQQQQSQPSSGAITPRSSAPPAELYQDLIDAKKRGDRVAVSSLVAAYRQLPASQQTTAGFNAALQAQVEVREPGSSLREVRETHQDMLEAGCLPNSSTSAVLVKALCARDQEKQADEATPNVAAEEQASSEAWRVLATSPSGLQDIEAYNALLARCAAKGDVQRAKAVYNMVMAAGEKALPNAATYTAMIDCYAAAYLESDADVTATLTALKSILSSATASMRKLSWTNDKDDDVFISYIRATILLDAPEEAVALFERQVTNEGGLASPSATVTEALVMAFAQAGDVETASAWIEKIETLEGMIAMPDFTELKVALREQRDVSPDHSDATPSAPASLASPITAPSITSTAPTSLLDTTTNTAVAEQPKSTSSPSINNDLGDRLKSLLRVRRNNQQPNLEAAYRLLITESQRTSQHAPPELISQLLNLFGRSGKLSRVHSLRALAHQAVASLPSEEARSAAWLEVEDSTLSALAHGGDVESAHGIRHSLLAAGVAPSANSYAALISSIRDSTDEALLAESLWRESQDLGVRPNIYLVNTVISRLGRARRADRALQLYRSLPELGLKPTSITYGASLNCAVRVGDVKTAEEIFEAMEGDPGFVARPPGYNSMIQFFTYTRPDREKALHYWERMQARGVKPSSHTYKLLLDVHGSISPPDIPGMNAIFLRLLRDHSTIPVTGPHWASLISCHSSNLAHCQDIFKSIPLKTGAKPDAVAYEALLQVYAMHARADLIDGLLGEMIRLGVERTAYIGNHAIDGYVAADQERTGEGLIKARAIFSAMAQPPAGVASVGNHPLPRHQHHAAQHQHQQGASTAPTVPIEEVLAATMSGSTSTSATSAAPSSTSPAPLSDTLSLLHRAFSSVHPEPSTYERIIALEVAAGCLGNAEQVVARMEERAFPPALVIKARGLLQGPRQGPLTSMMLAARG